MPYPSDKRQTIFTCRKCTTTFQMDDMTADQEADLARQHSAGCRG